MKWLRWLFDAACVAVIGYVAVRIMLEGPLVAQIGVMILGSTAFVAWLLFAAATRQMTLLDRTLDDRQESLSRRLDSIGERIDNIER